MILFFDTETTGLVEPRLVQLGMILCTSELEVVSECCILVQPAKKIEEGAIRAHGITNDYAMRNGVNLQTAVSCFISGYNKASLLVAHNISYDEKVMQNECFSLFSPNERPDFLKEKFCTMEACTPICKLPHKNANYAKRSGYKWPKLEEAYQYFFNKPIQGAHNALTDCRATLEIYKKLMQIKAIESGKDLVINANGSVMDNGTVRVD